MDFVTHRVALLTGHTGPVNAVSFSSGLGQYILTGSSDRSIHLYNHRKGTPSAPGILVQSFKAHGYEVLDLAVSEDNSRFVSVGGDKLVFLWDVTTAKTLRRWHGHLSKVNAVDYGAEHDSVVATGSYDTTVRLWDSKSRDSRPLQILDDAKDSVLTVKIYGWTILSGGADGKLRIYDIRSGLVVESSFSAPVTSIQQTKDSNACLISTLDSKIRLIDNTNGTALQTYQGHVNQKYRISSCFSGSERRVLSGSETGMIHIWETADCASTQNLSLGTDVVTSVTWNARSGEWASASTNGHVQIWQSSLDT